MITFSEHLIRSLTTHYGLPAIAQSYNEQIYIRVNELAKASNDN